MFKIFKSSTFKNEESDIRPWVFNRVSNLRKAGFSDKEIVDIVYLNNKEKELLKLDEKVLVNKTTKEETPVEENNEQEETSVEENNEQEETSVEENNEQEETSSEEETPVEENNEQEETPVEENNEQEETKEENNSIYDIIDDASLEMLTDDVYEQFKMIFNVKREKIKKLIINIILDNPNIVKSNSYYYICMKLCNMIEDLIVENTIGTDDEEKDPILEELNSLLD